MTIQIEEALNQLPLTTLCELGSTELERFRAKASSEERYCVELVHRALVDQSDEAWSAFQQCFSEPVRAWIRSHPSRDVALPRDSEENYLAQTFSRFWYAVRDQSLQFRSLPAVLSYLHATLNGVLTDTLRSHLRQRAWEVPLPEPGCPQEPGWQDLMESERLWEAFQKLLVDERERRLFFLLYGCGLKPREVVRRCPQEYADVKEIYRLNANIIDRLRRSRDRLHYLLEGDV